MDLTKVLESNIGRIVAGLVLPLLLPITGAFAAWLQDAAGVDLDGAALASYVAAVVVGVALAGYKWLANRGEFEQAVVQTTLWQEEGKRYAEEAVVKDDKVV